MALDHHRGGIDFVALPPHHRRRIAGHPVLVNRGVPIQYLAIDRNFVTRVDQDDVARRKLFVANAHLLALAFNQRLALLR